MVTKIQNCPECGRRLHILQPRPGKRVVCPQCGQPFFPAGQTWLETPARSFHFLPSVKPLWAMAALLLLAGLAGGIFFFNRSASAKPASSVPVILVSSPDKPDARAEFSRLMIEGNAALAGQQFSDAIASYKEAQKLFPEDVDAAWGLAQAQVALAAAQNGPPTDPYLDTLNKNVQVAEKAIVDQQANRSDFIRLMNQASVAMLDGNYDDARTAYMQALALATDPAGSPVLALSGGDPLAPPLIQATQSDAAPNSYAALDGLREANYQKAMADADLAMRTQHYGDAMDAYQAALRQRPNDPDAASGLMQARAYGA